MNTGLGWDLYDDTFQDCLVTGKGNSYSIDIGSTGMKPDMGGKRYYAAAVALNETTLWIVGGRIARKKSSSKYSFATRTSLFVTLNKTAAINGPVLPKHPGARYFYLDLWFLDTALDLLK